MVMGRDSRSEGRGFESQHRILDGHFLHICCKNCNDVCLKTPKINKKRPGLVHFFNLITLTTREIKTRISK